MMVTGPVTPSRCKRCNAPCDGNLIFHDSAGRVYCCAAHRSAQLRAEMEIRIATDQMLRKLGVRR